MLDNYLWAHDCKLVRPPANVVLTAGPLIRVWSFSFSFRLTRRETSPTSSSRRIMLGWADGASPEEPNASSPDGSNPTDVWVSSYFYWYLYAKYLENLTLHANLSRVSILSSTAEMPLFAKLKIEIIFCKLHFSVCRRERRSRQFFAYLYRDQSLFFLGIKR